DLVPDAHLGAVLAGEDEQALARARVSVALGVLEPETPGAAGLGDRGDHTGDTVDELTDERGLPCCSLDVVGSHLAGLDGVGGDPVDTTYLGGRVGAVVSGGGQGRYEAGAEGERRGGRQGEDQWSSRDRECSWHAFVTFQCVGVSGPAHH